MLKFKFRKEVTLLIEVPECLDEIWNMRIEGLDGVAGSGDTRDEALACLKQSMDRWAEKTGNQGWRFTKTDGETVFIFDLESKALAVN